MLNCEATRLSRWVASSEPSLERARASFLAKSGRAAPQAVETPINAASPASEVKAPPRPQPRPAEASSNAAAAAEFLEALGCKRGEARRLLEGLNGTVEEMVAAALTRRRAT